MMITGAVFFISTIVGYLVLPSYLVGARLAKANISIGNVGVVIDKETTNVVDPQIHMFAPKELLAFPLLSFTATVPPTVAKAYSYVDGMSRPGQGKPPQVLVEIGTFHLAETINLDSSKDVNLVLKGSFTVTAPQYLPSLVHNFIVSPSVPLTVKASVDVSAWAWGWLPVKFWSIPVTYSMAVPAFDNFNSHMIALDQILAADGKPSQLGVKCTATVYNPTPLSLVVNTNMRMKIAYDYLGSETVVGMIEAENISIQPGLNTPAATLLIQQDGSNQGAITGLITAYMGGLQKGFQPAAQKPFQVRVHDEGADTSDTALLRQALAGLSIGMMFRPKPVSFITMITADVVIGGSIIHGRLYECTLHLTIKNPLPAPARLRGVDLEAFTPQLTNGTSLYNFNHEHLDSSKYIVPSANDPKTGGVVTLDFSLGISEVALPTSFKEIEKLATQALHRKMTMGITAKIYITVDGENGGYHQTVEYRNEELAGIICYNLFEPDKICGS